MKKFATILAALLLVIAVNAQTATLTGSLQGGQPIDPVTGRNYYLELTWSVTGKTVATATIEKRTCPESSYTNFATVTTNSGSIKDTNALTNTNYFYKLSVTFTDNTTITSNILDVTWSSSGAKCRGKGK